MEITFKNIETIFLDAGNTLVSMNLGWFAEELKTFGLECPVQEIRRAEASARPLLSSELPRLKSTENKKTSAFYIKTILNRLSAVSAISEAGKNEITDHLLKTVSAGGENHRVWNHIIPGVIEALDILKGKGLKLAVVSNSDGSVEKILTGLKMDNYFAGIYDSHNIGYEKPDPRLFRYALKACNADSETTLHIGDLYHVDVLGAWKANLKAVLLDPFGDWDGYDCPRFPDLITIAKIFNRES